MAYKFTDEGKAKIKLYIEEFKAEREAILEAKLDTVDEVAVLTEEDILMDMEITTVDYDGIYHGFFDVSDNRIASKVLTLNEGVDFYEV